MLFGEVEVCLHRPTRAVGVPALDRPVDFAVILDGGELRLFRLERNPMARDKEVCQARDESSEQVVVARSRDSVVKLKACLYLAWDCRGFSNPLCSNLHILKIGLRGCLSGKLSGLPLQGFSHGHELSQGMGIRG